jgi:DNA invertase Pin-like site-specific DNA recombinase
MIDRLSQSLMDFAELAEVIDVLGVAFVSVTQSFTTSTSKRRLRKALQVVEAPPSCGHGEFPLLYGARAPRC